MRGRINALVVLLLFLALFTVVLVIRKHAEQTQLSAVKNVTIIRRPYQYTISWKIVGPEKLEILINITKQGNVQEFLTVNVSKLSYPNVLQPVTKTRIRLVPGKKVIAFNLTIRVNPRRDEKILVEILDNIKGKVDSFEIPLYHHSYNVSLSLLNNYTLQARISVINYTLLSDKLDLRVMLKSPIESKKLADYRFTVEPSPELQIKRSSLCNINYCVNFSQHGNNYTIVLHWKLIGAPWAYINVSLLDTNLLGSDSAFEDKALLDWKVFRVTPPTIVFGSPYKTRDNLEFLVSEVYGSYNVSIYNFTYYKGGRRQKVDLPCKYINGLYMCYGVISLTVKNEDSVGHSISIDPRSIICVNSRMAMYSSQDYKGILGDSSFYLEPLQSKTIYIYCLLPYGSWLYMLYLRYSVDRNLQEIVVTK